MAEVVTIGDATLYHGDCLEILPTLGVRGCLEGRCMSPTACEGFGYCRECNMFAVISDPPYGMRANTDMGRFSGGSPASITRRKGTNRVYPPIVGDDAPFDPTPWLGFPVVVLFGCNHFAARLPVGTTLVWIKRKQEAFGTFLSDAEVAWMKGGHGVYCFSSYPQSMALDREHPTQKPVDLMVWCLQRTGTTRTVLDPYMGSGTTGVACAQLGRKFIGIEIERKYFDIACERIDNAYRQQRMFA
jgi:site-specific DNA-methyltransferase (adenine-specific)